MSDQEGADQLLQYLEESMGSEEGRQVYDQLPEEVETPEDFEEWVEQQSMGGLPSQQANRSGPSEQSRASGENKQEPVVGRDEEQVALEKLSRAARPLVAEFMNSQEEQRRIEKEERQEELKHEERIQKRWTYLLAVVLVMVFVLTIYFGQKSAQMGLQIFTHITTAVVGGLGGYGIGRSENMGD